MSLIQSRLQTPGFCVRVHGNDEPIMRERISWLITGGLEVTPLDAGLGAHRW